MKKHCPLCTNFLFAENYKFFKISFLIFIFYSFSFTNAFCQTTTYVEEWYENTGVSDNIASQSISLNDSQKNLYVATSTLSASSTSSVQYYDVLLTKYDPEGTILWEQIFNTGSQNAFVGDMVLENNLYPVIVGSGYNDANSSYDVFIVKYNQTGIEQWHQTFNGGATSHDGARKLFIQNNEIYVAGGATSLNSQLDFLTLKYNTSGVLQWSQSYDYQGLNDAAVYLRASSSTLYVGGVVESSAGIYEQASLRYNSSSGVLIDNSVSNGMSLVIQKVNDVAIDDVGNIYITGGFLTNQGYDMKTVKLDENLQVLWENTYGHPSGGEDIANDISLDNNNDVYVTGYSIVNSRKQVTTIKYTNSGTEVWVNSQTEEGEREGKKVVVNSTGEVFTAGYIKKDNGSSKDFLLMEYKNASGAKIWEKSFNGLANKDEEANQISIDNDGNLHLSGRSKEASDENTFLTIKYRRSEVLIPPSDNPHSAFNYIENKGQLLDVDGTSIPDIKYYNVQGNHATYFSNDMLSMVVSSLDDDQNTQDTLHRVDLVFNDRADVRSSMQVAALNEQRAYFNYFLTHIPEGRARVRGFDNIVYSNIYENIDLVYSSNNRGSKFYVICKPNSNPNEIEWLFTGQNNLSIGTNNELIIGTSLENIIFPQAIAFQIDGIGNEVNLSWQPNFTISNNKVSFSSIGSYNNSESLVFEFSKPANPSSAPGVHWITPYNNNGEVICLDVTKTGETTELFTTVGRYNFQPYPNNLSVTNFNSNTFGDIEMATFDEVGIRQWVTLFGNAAPTDIKIIPSLNQEFQFVVSGYSGGGIPIAPQTSTSSFQGGATDGMMFVLSQNGDNLLFSEYFGTSQDDEINGIAFNRNFSDKLYLCGYTNGSSSIITPTINNSYNKTTNNNLIDDALLMEINLSDFTVGWGSLFGGGGNERFQSITINPNNGNVICLGTTDTKTHQEINSPSTSANNNNNDFQRCIPSGAYSQIFGNSTVNQYANDLIIVEFSPERELIWSTYLGSPHDEELSNFYNDYESNSKIAFSKNSSEWAITGTTLSIDEFPHANVSSDMFQYIYDGYGQFIVKFDGRSMIWSTGFYKANEGANNAGNGSGIAYDDFGNLFFKTSLGMTYFDFPAPSEYCIEPSSTNLKGFSYKKLIDLSHSNNS